MGWQNFYATRLSVEIGTSDTTLTVDTAPSKTSGRLVLEARNPTKREIISYTGVSGNDLTGVTRGEGGTTAKTHNAGALVEMNLVAEDLEDALAVPSDIITRFDESLGDFVASGMVWSQTSLLVGEMTAGVIYVDGYRREVAAISGKSFGASKDTYIDFDNTGAVDYNEVANGAAAPALAANSIRVAKVVTDGTTITDVVTSGVDGNELPINPVSPLSYVYPVGSIYINASTDTNPATLLGFGTWEAFGAGRVLVGLDSGDTDFDTAEETGGHKELQEHHHITPSEVSAGGSAAIVRSGSMAGTGQNNSAGTTTDSGTGDSGNLQPYIVVYMWKRTA